MFIYDKRFFYLFIILFFLPFYIFADTVTRAVKVISSLELHAITSVASEYFGQLTRFRTPIVDSASHDNEYNVFCVHSSFSEDKDVEEYDILISLKEIRETDLLKCKKNNILDLKKVELGYVVLVFAQNENSIDFDLSYKVLYDAISAHVLSNGVIVRNQNKLWSDISYIFPNRNIQLHIPSVESVIYRMMINYLILPECMGRTELKSIYFGYDVMRKKCLAIRSDGRVALYSNKSIASSVIKKMQEDMNIISMMDYSTFKKYQSLGIKAMKVEGIEPTEENIKNGKYILAKPVFLYYKSDMIDKIEGMKDFINSFDNTNAIGVDGYLVKQGLTVIK